MAQKLSEGVLPTAALRYRRVLTGASAISFVSILLAFWGWFPKGESRFLGLLFLLLVLLPYAFIPLRLYGQKLRSGLNLALAMGCALCVPGIYLVRFAFTWDRRWWILGNLILALSMQPILIVTAGKIHIHLPRLKHSRLKLLVSLAYGFLLFVLFWLFYSPVPFQINKNEHSAMKYLAASAMAAFADAYQHEGLYPEALDNLGPNSSPKCTSTPHVIDHGNPTGYLFEYRGVQPSTTLQGCSRFKGFAMTARPVVFGKTGIRSFCVDRSLSIHFTSENRPANVSDPADFTVWLEHRPQ